MEDPDYGSYTLSTLRRVASALDVALVVRFVPFSQLVDYTTNVSPADLHVVSFDADEQLRTGLDAEEPLEFTPPTATQRRRLGEASTTYDAEHQGD